MMADAYRAVLMTKRKLERPVQGFFPTLEACRQWAFGSRGVGQELDCRPILEQPEDLVRIYRQEEHLVETCELKGNNEIHTASD